MSKRAASAAYLARMQRVLDHIETHLDAPLPVAELAAVAAFSEFHFQRQFKALTGLPVARYIQARRLTRAGLRLAFRPDASVTEIGLETGYDSPDAFARAFRRWIGQSPSLFRADPDWPAWAKARTDGSAAAAIAPPGPDFAVDAVDVLDLPETPVGLLSHRGPPDRLGETLREFIAWRKECGLVPPRSPTFNLLYADPDLVPPDQFRLDLCAGTLGRPVEPTRRGVVPALLPGGRFARLRVTGGDARLARAIDWLYGAWLPDSGLALRDTPLIAQRHRFFPDVAEHEAMLDLFLPVCDPA